MDVIPKQAPAIALTRKEIYDEIWDISVSGLARKYNIPYSRLLKQVRTADIPTPSSGYWTKLEFGKPVEKSILQGMSDEVVLFCNDTPDHREKKEKELKVVSGIRAKSASPKKALPRQKTGNDDVALSDNDADANKCLELGAPDEYEKYGRMFNVYDRKTLYEEVWTFPVTEVAKKYKVSDVTIHKVCKAMDVPTPPLGYWAKHRAGKSVKKTPLPKSDKPSKREGIQTGIEPRPSTEGEMLAFLPDEEKLLILAAATNVTMPDDDERMHPKLIDHRKLVSEWMKELKERKAKRWNRQGMDKAPFLADTISEKSLPRVLHIVDALIKNIEPLGNSLTDYSGYLRFMIRNETVYFAVTEAKDEIPHVLTKEENMSLLEYEDDKKRYNWASKPNIRKYDRPYNGRITFTIDAVRSFRDCKSYKIEDRIGDIIVALYEASDMARIHREKQEEIERKRQEAERLEQERERLEEERIERYNSEIELTRDLVNEAEDYDTASKIRNYILALEGKGDLSLESCNWIEWAKSKADWFDPTVKNKDDLLGKRAHGEKLDLKESKHKNKWWY
jgi:hypothetical protein